MSGTQIQDGDVVAAVESVMHHKAEAAHAADESGMSQDESLLAGWRAQHEASVQPLVTVVKC